MVCDCATAVSELLNFYSAAFCCNYINAETEFIGDLFFAALYANIYIFIYLYYKKKLLVSSALFVCEVLNCSEVYV